jgi:hypothetical protein
MNYFQVLGAHRRVHSFNEAYAHFLQGVEEGQADAAERAQRQMRALAPKVQRDLDNVGKGQIRLLEVPLVRGKMQLAPVAELALDPQLLDQYSLQSMDVTVRLQEASREYSRLRGATFVNLFNPLWWLREILAFLFRLPFYPFALFGLDRRAIEDSPGGQAVKVLLSFAVILVAFFFANQRYGWLESARQALAGQSIRFP